MIKTVCTCDICGEEFAEGAGREFELTEYGDDGGHVDFDTCHGCGDHFWVGIREVLLGTANAVGNAQDVSTCEQVATV